jgi:N-acetylglucosamine kinase-like BadF-type ATPase
MNFYLGIDGGGTKTAALILDGDGQERGRGAGGPANIATHDAATVACSLREAVGAAREDAGLSAETEFAAACAGVAGYSVEEKRAVFADLLRAEACAAAYLLVPDYEIAYWGATHGAPGIVVIAGTGAVSYGRNAQGETWREDGLGYLLGDRGSGFNLGVRALRYMLAERKEGRSDALTEAVMAHTGARTQSQTLQWLYGQFSPARVATLAPVVGALAESGDEAARALVTEMAARLRNAVRQIRHKLWLPRDTPIYPLGGLWQIGAFFRSEFEEPRPYGDRAASFEAETVPGGRFPLAEPKNDAVYGAALLARGKYPAGRPEGP